MRTASLFGERSLTLVAATFSDRVTPAAAASALRATMPGTEVTVVRPLDADLARKLEPDAQGIWRTLIRSHLVLGLIGLGLGVAVAATLVGVNWPAAAGSPVLMTLFLSTLGLFAGLMVAGLLTLRPDRGRVTLAIRRRNRAGQWAVVTHPTSRAQSERAIRSLRQSGGTVLRSL